MVMQSSGEQRDPQGEIKAAVLKRITEESEQRKANNIKPPGSKVLYLPNKIDDALQFPDIMSGAAGEFARVMASYLEPASHFFYMAFLTCLGNAMSDRATLKSEIKPELRLFVLILGESADDRKSTAISKTVSFFREAIIDFPVCHGVGSAEGLQKKIAESKRLLLCLDEFKAFVAKCRIESSVLLPCVTTLFESRYYESRTKKEPLVIDDASLSLLAASTIQTYETIFDESFLAIGFPNRLFLCPGKGERKFSIPKQIPDADKIFLKHRLAEILKHVDGKLLLDVAPDARDFFHQWYITLPQSIHAKRLDTYALRLMGLIAINDLKNYIDFETIQKTIALCNWQFEVWKRYDPIDADSSMARLEEKIRRVLSAGKLDKRALGRAIHAERVGVWMYKNALSNLISSEQVIWDKKEKVYVVK